MDNAPSSTHHPPRTTVYETPSTPALHAPPSTHAWEQTRIRAPAQQLIQPDLADPLQGRIANLGKFSRRITSAPIARLNLSRPDNLLQRRATMNHYDYSATCSTGAAMRGTIESADEPAALDLLRGMGLQDVAVTRARTPALRRPLGADDFIFFNEQLAALASSGIALEQGLRHLAKDIDSPRLRHTIDDVAAQLERGAPLDEAVAREAGNLPPLYGRVIRAGLAGGHLSSTLLNLSNHLRFLTHTRRLIVQALAYPGMVCLLAGGILCAILIWVVPSFEDIYLDFDVQLPRMTSLLILMSHYLPEILVVLGVAAAAVVLFYLFTLATAGGRALRERVVVGLPLLGRLVLDSMRARFLRGLAHGVQAGLPLPEALRLSAEAMGSSAGLSEAEAVARVVESGGTVMDATRKTKFVPPILGYVLQVCATPADAEQALIQLAEGYSSRAEHAQLVMRTWLPPAAIFVVGAFIALSILGVFLPLVSLVESVSG